MSNNDKVVSDYGWQNREAKPYQTYLASPIRDTLAKPKARIVLDFGYGNGVLAHWLLCPRSARTSAWSWLDEK